jgi:hypothetical protein
MTRLQFHHSLPSLNRVLTVALLAGKQPELKLGFGKIWLKL